MEITTPTVGGHTVAYGKDHLFDLETGMAVYEEAGAKIGTVTEVAGFGSTQIGPVPSHGSDDRVTQAQTGTGFFKVKPDAVESGETPDLCIPFHAIREVRLGRGVILNDRFVSGVQQDPTNAHGPTASTSRVGGWRKWLPGASA